MNLSKTKSNFFDGRNYGVPNKLLVVVYFAGTWNVSVSYKMERNNGISGLFEGDTQREDIRDFIHRNFKEGIDINFQE